MKLGIMASISGGVFAVSTAVGAVIQLSPSGTTAISTYYINKNGTGPGNGNNSDNQLYRLNTYFLLSSGVPTDSLKPATQTFDWSTGGLADYDYAVIHFGKGAYGGNGGSVGAWDLNGMDSFTFPTKGFSSIDLFRFRPLDDPKSAPPVPDGGTTLLSLGISLLGLGGFRRFFMTKA